MKKVVSLLLAVLMLTSLLSVVSSARGGYVLSVPADMSLHELEAYGLHTMNVYETEIAPTIDGKIGTGEYPGPNNGCSLSSIPGDNMWMSTYKKSGATGRQDNYSGYHDFTDYIAEEDKPE